MKINKRLIYGPIAIFLFLMFFGGICDPDQWQDHLDINDPILGGIVASEVINWFGEWTMYNWWYQNADGEREEEEDHEGYVLYNEDGTCEFQIFDDPTADRLGFRSWVHSAVRLSSLEIEVDTAV